ALYEHSFSPEGFEWIEAGDSSNSVLAYVRKGVRPEDDLLIMLNLTPVVRYAYRCGLPAEGEWAVVLNSDDRRYDGSGMEQHTVTAEPIRWMNKDWSAMFTLPPLAGLVLKRSEAQQTSRKRVQQSKKTALVKAESAVDPEKKAKKRATGKKATAKKTTTKGN